MAQQTAVEWLDRWFRDNPEATHEEGNKALEQAKQMEKKQHKHTWLYEGNIDNASYERFERYYQVTFGGQGSPDTSPNTQNK